MSVSMCVTGVISQVSSIIWLFRPCKPNTFWMLIMKADHLDHLVHQDHMECLDQLDYLTLRPPGPPGPPEPPRPPWPLWPPEPPGQTWPIEPLWQPQLIKWFIKKNSHCLLCLVYLVVEQLHNFLVWSPLWQECLLGFPGWWKAMPRIALFAKFDGNAKENYSVCQIRGQMFVWEAGSGLPSGPRYAWRTACVPRHQQKLGPRFHLERANMGLLSQLQWALYWSRASAKVDGQLHLYPGCWCPPQILMLITCSDMPTLDLKRWVKISFATGSMLIYRQSREANTMHTVQCLSSWSVVRRRERER